MLFTNLKGFNWVQDDGTMLISMVEMSTKKKKKSRPQKKKKFTCPQSGCTDNTNALQEFMSLVRSWNGKGDDSNCPSGDMEIESQEIREDKATNNLRDASGFVRSAFC